jgi:protein translocase SecG subunit
MDNIIPIVQIIVAVFLIGLVLLQQRGGAGLGSAFGQGTGAYSTQRGIQKKIFYITIVMGVFFVALAVYNLFQK